MADDGSKQGLRPAVLEDQDRRSRIVLVSLLDLDSAARSRAIEIVAAALAPGETPLFVTDDPDFRPFASRNYLYEYLPPPSEQARFADGEEWETYLAARFKVMLRKWAPVRLVEVGTPFQGFIVNARTAQYK